MFGGKIIVYHSGIKKGFGNDNLELSYKKKIEKYKTDKSNEIIKDFPEEILGKGLCGYIF